LREAVEMLLVGRRRRVATNPSHAALLARRLIEYKVTGVINLYELKLGEGCQFVKLFLGVLVHLPRELWRPTLVVLDEARIYCPERGSEEAGFTEAVIRLMSQGRKRGYAGVIAAQRLSKLHKDARQGQQHNYRAHLARCRPGRAGDALGLSRADRISCVTSDRMSSVYLVRH
jgi:DNA helicase HerA-like ATPase